MNKIVVFSSYVTTNFIVFLIASSFEVFSTTGDLFNQFASITILVGVILVFWVTRIDRAKNSIIGALRAIANKHKIPPDEKGEYIRLTGQALDEAIHILQKIVPMIASSPVFKSINATFILTLFLIFFATVAKIFAIGIISDSFLIVAISLMIASYHAAIFGNHLLNMLNVIVREK